MITKVMHQNFERFHEKHFGFYTTRMHDPDFIHDYDNPFTQGAWKTYLLLEHKISYTEDDF